MVFPKCCLVSVYSARIGSLFVAILGSVAVCRFVEEYWCFSRGCFLWKAGTPWPRQRNQCSSWLRGRGGRGGCGLFYLISVSARASVWCKRVPPHSLLYLFFSSLSVLLLSYLSHSGLSASFYFKETNNSVKMFFPVSQHLMLALNQSSGRCTGAASVNTGSVISLKSEWS